MITYMDKALNAFRDKLMSEGVSGVILDTSLLAFEYGFEVGIYEKDSPILQEIMIDKIIN